MNNFKCHVSGLLTECMKIKWKGNCPFYHQIICFKLIEAPTKPLYVCNLKMFQYPSHYICFGQKYGLKKAEVENSKTVDLAQRSCFPAIRPWSGYFTCLSHYVPSIEWEWETNSQRFVKDHRECIGKNDILPDSLIYDEVQLDFVNNLRIFKL